MSDQSFQTYTAAFKDLRKRLGLSQREMAECFNTSQTVIHKLETGHSVVTIEIIRQLCDLFKLDILSVIPNYKPHDTAPQPNPPAFNKRTKVFVSYSHRDFKWLGRLQVHLAPLIRLGKVNLWDDSQIRTSQRWKEEIRHAIDTAKVAVLLVSADFLASGFIATDELPPLLAAAKDAGAFIMPVIISPCRFTATPILCEFQAVNPPTSPLVGMRQKDREALWVKLTNDIEDALSGKLITE